MSRQNIAIGSAANDGTGDTLRQAGIKINQNFAELYERFGGDSSALSSQITIEDSAIAFEGSAADGFETRLSVVNPTADRVVQIPNASGVVVLDNATQTLTNKTLTSPTIATPKITTRIDDANGNELIRLTATGSAVNDITIQNNTTGNAPVIASSGGDSNINLNLSAKGTGSVVVEKAAFSSVEITADVSASSTASYIVCNKGSALAVDLDSGGTTGEFKIFTNKGAGTATVTPTSFAQGTSFVITQYGAAQCIWDGTDWYLFGRDSNYVTITP